MVSMNIGEIKFHGNFASFEENSNEIYKRYDIETTKDLIKYFILLASKDTIGKNNYHNEKRSRLFDYLPEKSKEYIAKNRTSRQRE